MAKNASPPWLDRFLFGFTGPGATDSARLHRDGGGHCNPRDARRSHGRGLRFVGSSLRRNKSTGCELWALVQSSWFDW